MEGFTNREIAESLGISQHTVKNYLFKIFEKVGMSNRVELVFNLLSDRAGPRTEDATMRGSRPNLDDPLIKANGSGAEKVSSAPASSVPSPTTNVPTPSRFAQTG